MKYSCNNCEKWSLEEHRCNVCSCKPPVTGNPMTCPYYHTR